jgi:SAM-dependent methyltransferase
MSTTPLKGIFLNAPKANCSIYESGIMVYDCLKLSGMYSLDYMELDEYTRDIPNSYDFYAFNYHHVRMSWLDTSSVKKLPGLKLTFVLEVLPNDPFPLCPRDAFDVYCALDPTMASPDPRVYAFPRPLEAPPVLAPYADPELPVIGTFGFATRGKGFEQVVAAVNREFDRAVVRVNIPPSEFAARSRGFSARKDYGDVLGELCRTTAKPGIEVEVTREFLSKPDLIRWCGRNTLNCFLYDRRQPGLSATTDQAIVSGRPMAVSDNPTFRHIHAYSRPYPERSLKEAIALSQAETARMREDWAPRRFANRFDEVLRAQGLPGDHPASAREHQIIHLDVLPVRTTISGRWNRVLRKTRFVWEDRFAPVPQRPTLCKFLISRAEVRESTAWLRSRGLMSHRITFKDWDIASILRDMPDGNLLDMGSSDSFLLKNAVLSGLKGDKVGIDLQRPDVPVDGVRYVIGDLTKTGLSGGSFQSITCLSVIEHGIDFNAFAVEAARLLAPGGKLYVTFDYWSPRVAPRLRLFGVPWNILDETEARRLISACEAAGLSPTHEVDWTLKRPVIGPWNYSPDPAVSYTFGLLTFTTRPDQPRSDTRKSTS